MTRRQTRRYLKELDRIELRLARLERASPTDPEVLDLIREVRIRRVAALERVEAAGAKQESVH